MSKSFIVRVLVVLALLVAAGCSLIYDSSGFDTGSASDAGTLKIIVADVSVVQNSEATFPVSIVRPPGFDDTVKLTFSAVPGCSFGDAAIPIGQSTTTVKVNASKDATQTVTTVTVTAIGKLSGQAPFKLDVRGAPGTLDGAFGTGGIVAGPDPVIDVRDVAVQPDGKILVLGGTATQYTTLWRFRADGSLDDTFGVGGVAGFDTFPGLGTRMALQDGKIVTTTGGSPSSYVVRFGGDGKVDTTFGTSGMFTIQQMSASAIYARPDGKVMIGGKSSLGPMVVVQLQGQGKPDGTFADAGFVGSPTGSPASVNGIFAPSATGMIVGRGLSDAGVGQLLVGEVQQTGTISMSESGSDASVVAISNVAPFGDGGSAFVVGTTFGVTNRISLGRILETGNNFYLDKAFGSGGGFLSVGDNANATGAGVVVDGNDVYMCGTIGAQVLVVKANTSGTRDGKFGTNNPPNGASSFPLATTTISVAGCVLSNGKLVVVAKEVDNGSQPKVNRLTLLRIWP